MSHRPETRSGAAYLALSCVGFIASAAGAQTALPQEQQATQLQGVTVTDSVVEDAVKVDRLESPKATRPLVDTPQTITVISERVLQQQNLLTLRDALSTIPGITFGAGEGGGGFGDSINLRGYSANNDLLFDGVRDSAQYSRSETFNIQQIEVYNGANSVFNGAGSIGGSINLVQKTPLARDAVTVSAGIGTDDYYRGTVDANLRVSDLVAVRLNGVYHRNDYPGRDVERSRRWGVAPSVTIGIDSPTSLTFSYVHQEDDAVPVYGVPFYRTATNAGPLPGVDDSDYFGIVNLDDQDIVFDQATIRFAHAFSDTVSVRNLTRWQRVDQSTVTSAPQGTFCLASNFTPTGGACRTSFTTNVFYDGALRTGTVAAPFVVTNPAGTFLPNGPRGLLRDQENQLLYNQTDFKADFATGGLKHSFVLGVAFTQEDYHLDTGNLLRTAAGVTVVQSPIALGDPNTAYAGPVNFVRSGQSYGDTRNAAIYAFDTIALLPQLELSLGARYEKNRTEFRADTYSTTVGATLGRYARGAGQVSDDTLFSYRGGLNFKPTEWSSLYVAYANSRTPRSASVRAGCGTVIAGVGSAAGQSFDPCNVAPEKAVNYEIGAKAELFDRRLLLTAALFRNDRTNFSVNTNDPVAPTLPVQDGHSRVDGVALGASGNITDAWAIFANYTYLDSEIRQGVSDFCLANPGTTGCGNSAGLPDPQRGQIINQTPKHSGSLFTTYALPIGLQLGYGLTYQGSFNLNNAALIAGTPAGLTPVFKSRDYLIHRAFASYQITRDVAVQLNVQNFTDKRHFTGIRNNGWATPGEGRAARLALNYSF